MDIVCKGICNRYDGVTNKLYATVIKDGDLIVVNHKKQDMEVGLKKKITEHAKLHGHDTITPDLEKKLKSLIKEALALYFSKIHHLS